VAGGKGEEKNVADEQDRSGQESKKTPTVEEQKKRLGTSTNREKVLSITSTSLK